MKEHRYWVYVVGSSSGTLYTGMTNDFENYRERWDLLALPIPRLPNYPITQS